MHSKLVLVMVVPGLLMAAGKKPARGSAENEGVSVSATVLNAEEIRAAVGSDFHNAFVVLETHVTPKGGKTVAVRLDDFMLLSDADGQRSGPLVASQVADGGDALIVQQKLAPRTGPDMPQLIESTKVEMKGGGGKAAQIDTLKTKILAEKTTSEPETGWLFFPMEREKPKNLILLYTTPTGKLRIEFK